MSEMDGEEYIDWSYFVEDAYVLHSPDEPEEWKRSKYMTKTAEDEPKLTTEQEIQLMNQQVQASEGFDIDFSMFRCLFNYHPTYLDGNEFVDEPETNLDLLNRLSQKSLDNYNLDNETKYEFTKVLYANFHGSPGLMFMITFEVKDPFDNISKEFQARVYYSFFGENDYQFCRPKVVKKDLTNKDDPTNEKDIKKPRLE